MLFRCRGFQRKDGEKANEWHSYRGLRNARAEWKKTEHEAEGTGRYCAGFSSMCDELIGMWWIDYGIGRGRQDRSRVRNVSRIRLDA
jgi:hypothetical protein